jgi:deoxyribose-phosphate aldolase
MGIASYIDHTLLKPVATYIEIKKICEEANSYGFAAVCIPPPMIKPAKDYLGDSGVKLATVIGFPFGYSVTRSKMAEMQDAIDSQADEMDIVINLIHLKNGKWSVLETEMQLLCGLAHANHKIVKVIIETGMLSDEEIRHCCELYAGLKVDFLKTSTGYTETGATIEAVKLMHNSLPASVQIKASGGIRTYAFARQLIDAGATRLGCSASVAIVKGALSVHDL